MTKISTVLIVVFLTRQLKFLNCLKIYKLLPTKFLTLASELLSLRIIGIIWLFKQTFWQLRHRLYRQIDGKKSPGSNKRILNNMRISPELFPYQPSDIKMPFILYTSRNNYRQEFSDNKEHGFDEREPS